MLIRAISLLLFVDYFFLRVLIKLFHPVPVAALPQSRREYIPVGSMAASMPPRLCATQPLALSNSVQAAPFLWGGFGCGFCVLPAAFNVAADCFCFFSLPHTA